MSDTASRFRRIGHGSTHGENVPGIPGTDIGEFVIGRARPDHGPRMVNLRCDNPECGATWVGHEHDVCAYCELRHGREREWAT